MRTGPLPKEFPPPRSGEEVKFHAKARRRKKAKFFLASLAAWRELFFDWSGRCASGLETLSLKFMDDQEFQTRADEALHDLYKRLNAASDSGEFEADFNSGALAIEFEEPPGKFVVSPNAPVRQIWVSAHSRSFKLAWDDAREEFVLAGTGQSLADMVGEAISQQLGQEVKL
jgi:iron donor protein CyaY